MPANSKSAWPLSSILKATGGDLVAGSPSIGFAGINSDSRTISPDQCFVCLKGDVHDGHRFIPAVIRIGVRGIILDRAAVNQELVTALNDAGVAGVAVEDTLSALGDLAAFLRRRSGLSVLALTGSNGKTTTRAMAAHVASRRYRVLSPFGNFNNLVGVPLTLLRIEPGHEWAFLELGMNRPGEIRRLGHICSPDIGLITNVGPAHLAGFDSLEGIMEAKAELIEAISPDGTLVLNADDPRVTRLAKRARCRTLLFGQAPEAPIRASMLKSNSCGVSFRLHTPGGERRIQLRISGLFNVSNALAAAAVGICLEIPLDDIQAALQSFSPVPGRLNVLELADEVRLIDDTYNANPASVKEALGTLSDISGDRRRMAVLGDMFELGPASGELHRDVGCFAGQSGLAGLFVTGQFAGDVAQGARACGMAAEKIFCGAKDDIFERLEQIVRPRDWILVKGSRGMRMETLVDALKEKYGTRENPS